MVDGGRIELPSPGLRPGAKAVSANRPQAAGENRTRVYRFRKPAPHPLGHGSKDGDGEI